MSFTSANNLTPPHLNLPRRQELPEGAHYGNLPRLWVRTQAGPAIGFGHLRRSLTLASLLQGEVSPLFLISPGDVWTAESATERGWDSARFDRPTLSGRNKPHCVLIDTREVSGLLEFIQEMREQGIPVVSIHDLGLNPLPSDIAIDGSIAPEFEGFPRSGTCFVGGLKYLVLDPAFEELHRRQKSPSPEVRRVVVNLGGGDSSEYFHKVLESFRRCGRPIEVIGVPGFTSWGQQNLAEMHWKPVRFRWAETGESIADLLGQADLAVTAGGLSAFETLCAGVPLAALAYDSHQQKTIETIARRGACVNLGPGGNLDPGRAALVFALMQRDLHLRAALSQRGKRLVDGGGARRVCGIIRRHWTGAPAARAECKVS